MSAALVLGPRPPRARPSHDRLVQARWSGFRPVVVRPPGCRQVGTYATYLDAPVQNGSEREKSRRSRRARSSPAGTGKLVEGAPAHTAKPTRHALQTRSSPAGPVTSGCARTISGMTKDGTAREPGRGTSTSANSSKQVKKPTAIFKGVDLVIEPECSPLLSSDPTGRREPHCSGIAGRRDALEARSVPAKPWWSGTDQHSASLNPVDGPQDGRRAAAQTGS
jgi:hypothetical protein